MGSPNFRFICDGEINMEHAVMFSEVNDFESSLYQIKYVTEREICVSTTITRKERGGNLCVQIMMV